MTNESRRYRMRRRAEAEQQTRLRITESTVHLHRTVGPARTTISAIAEHAGVRRSTVYRHFPDELSLFTACTGHWTAANPMPAIERWAASEHPDARLRGALEEVYDYYERNESMLTSILRDQETPMVNRMLGGYRAYLASARDALMKHRKVSARARRRTAAAIGHALAFTTWQSLAVEQGLSQHQAVDLMCRFVASAAAA
jgi:AcrR family transcriptional regulator